MFQIERIKEKGQELLRLTGELTIYSAGEARKELEACLGAPSLSLDLSEIEEIDTSGVQILLWLKREASGKGHTVSLVRHSGAVIEAFDLLHVSGLFGDPILIGPA
jgi:anti-sigma B factor antagonist